MAKVILLKNSVNKLSRFLVFNKNVYNLIIDNKIKFKNIGRHIDNIRIDYNINLNIICEDKSLPIYKLHKSKKGIFHPFLTTWKWEDIMSDVNSIHEKENVFYDIIGDTKIIAKIKMLDS